MMKIYIEKKNIKLALLCFALTSRTETYFASQCQSVACETLQKRPQSQVSFPYKLYYLVLYKILYSLVQKKNDMFQEIALFLFSYLGPILNIFLVFLLLIKIFT